MEGETPKERALRQKVELLEKTERERRAEALADGAKPATPANKELTPEQKATLAKYKPQEIESLKEVIPVIAEQLGFVKAQDLTQTQYAERARETIVEWIDAHPEYKDQVLWDQVKAIADTTYKPPLNPKDWTKILNRIHTELSGIEPIGDKGALTAARQKIQVASHAGNSGPARTTTPSRSRVNSAGLRLDALSGFTDEEKEDIASRAEG